MSSRPIQLTIALTIVLSGCLHFDTFVFEALPVTNMNADLLAASLIPEQFRTEVFRPPGSQIITSDGTIVDAYLLTHSATDGTDVSKHNVALLYCHGQDTNIQTTVPRLDMLWLQGYTVLAFDYRGFGKTAGTPTDVGVNADTHAAYDWLAAQKPAYKVGVYGRSLGTAMCLTVAVDRQATALVLESPISSIQQIIDESTTITTPSDYYVDSQLNNLTEIPGYSGDLLIMHGLSDTYVPYIYGEELNALAEGPANGYPQGTGLEKVNMLQLIKGADHDTVPCISKVHATVDNSCVGALPPAGSLPSAAPGSGFNWLGNWTSSTQYAVGDIVVENGSISVALVANHGEDPAGTPSAWSLLPQGISSITGASPDYFTYVNTLYDGAFNL